MKHPTAAAADVQILSVVSSPPQEDAATPLVMDVTWSVSPRSDTGTVDYAASAPCTRGSSFDGSCLPFASETQAMEGPSTRGTAIEKAPGTGVYSARIATPNSYYLGLGTQLVPPALHVAYRAGGRDVRGAARVADGVPFRTLTYPSMRTGAGFYQPQIPATVRSQQEILFASAFPSDDPLGVFGTRHHGRTAAAATSPLGFWWGDA